MVYTDPIDDLIHHSSFWREIDDIPGSYWRFNPFGNSTVQIPEFWRNVVSQSIASLPIVDFQYTFSSGCQPLRQSILTHFAREAHLDPETLDANDNVACNLGALGLTEAIIQKNIENDDHEAIFMEPFYPWHFTAMKIGGKCKLARLVFDSAANEFRLDLEALESLLTPNTRIVVLCNPGNPNTRLFREEEYVALSKLLDKFPKVKVIEDCAYFCYTNVKDRDIKYFHEIGDNFKRTYTIFSGGKVFNTTGVRLGWCFMDKPLGKELKEYLWHYNMASALDQQIFTRAVAEATKPYGNFKTYWDYVREDNRARLEFTTKLMTDMGLQWYPSEGTYYLLFDARELSRRVEDKYFLTMGENPVKEPFRDRAVCRKLILEKKMGMMPVSAQYVGKPGPDHLIRMVCNRSYEDIEMILAELKALLNSPILR